MAADVGEGVQPDRLSDLPDAILVSILSLLKLDEAARCSVLSSHWRRRIFPLTLLNFRAFVPRRHDVIRAVNSVLAAHPAAPVRSFRAKWNRRGGDKKELHSDGGLFAELARRGVEEISLESRKMWHRIPPALLACASLARLELSSGTLLPDAVASPIALPRLTEIELWDVTASGDSLRAMISQCPALERLRMYCMGKCPRAHIWSPTLKVLNTDGSFEEPFIEYAPKLEWVHGQHMHQRAQCEPGVHLKVAHAPKLELLGYLGMSMDAIEIGETVFRGDYIRVNTLMPSMKTLTIEVSYTRAGYINWIVQLLKLFPCLESLYIKSDSWSVFQAPSSDSWDSIGYVPCVDEHLKTVVFEVYRGHEWQRKMAMFLNRSCKLLRTMEFHCLGDKDAVWVEQQRELLCLDRRASEDARFLFFRRQLSCNHWDVSGYSSARVVQRKLL